jgi:hypothetical protein
VFAKKVSEPAPSTCISLRQGTIREIRRRSYHKHFFDIRLSVITPLQVLTLPKMTVSKASDPSN